MVINKTINKTEGDSFIQLDTMTLPSSEPSHQIDGGASQYVEAPRYLIAQANGVKSPKLLDPFEALKRQIDIAASGGKFENLVRLLRKLDYIEIISRAGESYEEPAANILRGFLTHENEEVRSASWETLKTYPNLFKYIKLEELQVNETAYLEFLKLISERSSVIEFHLLMKEYAFQVSGAESQDLNVIMVIENAIFEMFEKLVPQASRSPGKETIVASLNDGLKDSKTCMFAARCFEKLETKEGKKERPAELFSVLLQGVINTGNDEVKNILSKIAVAYIKEAGDKFYDNESTRKLIAIDALDLRLTKEIKLATIACLRDRKYDELPFNLVNNCDLLGDDGEVRDATCEAIAYIVDQNKENFSKNPDVAKREKTFIELLDLAKMSWSFPSPKCGCINVGAAAFKALGYWPYDNVDEKEHKKKFLETTTAIFTKSYSYLPRDIILSLIEALPLFASSQELTNFFKAMFPKPGETIYDVVPQVRAAAVGEETKGLLSYFLSNLNETYSFLGFIGSEKNEPKILKHAIELFDYWITSLLDFYKNPSNDLVLQCKVIRLLSGLYSSFVMSDQQRTEVRRILVSIASDNSKVEDLRRAAFLAIVETKDLKLVSALDEITRAEGQTDWVYSLADESIKQLEGEIKSVNDLCSLAQRYIKSEVYGRALVQVNKAIIQDPNNALAHTLRAVVYFKQEAFSKAEAEFQNAMRLDPDSKIILAHAGYGIVLFSKAEDLQAQEKSKESGELYAKAYARLQSLKKEELHDPLLNLIIPDALSVIYYIIGCCLIKTGKDRTAITYLSKISNPGAPIHYAKAQAYYNLGEEEHSYSALSAAFELKPDDYMRKTSPNLRMDYFKYLKQKGVDFHPIVGPEEEEE